MASYDIIIVGSGINSLVAAALLGRKGYKVCVLERNNWLGGCIRTDEITLPGFHHDVFSSWHPLFTSSPAYAELADELAEHGLSYANTDKPTAALLPDGRRFILHRSREDTLAEFQQHDSSEAKAFNQSMADIEQNAELIFGLLSSDVRKLGTAWLAARWAWKTGFKNSWDFAGSAMEGCRKWLENGFTDEEVKACFAPWVLHAGLGPDDAFSGLMGKLVAFTLEQVGMPIVQGGSKNLVEAFTQLIEKNNGTLITNTHVTRILTKEKKVCGVTTSDGKKFTSRKAVICNVTPTQLYCDLLERTYVSEPVRRQAASYRYGNACMQIHLALNTPPKWQDSRLTDVAIVHLTPGLNGVSKAVSEARCGLLPQEATIVVGQPTALDPSRAPEGKAILWIQLQELPWRVTGDAAGEIPIPDDGKWDDKMKNAYADRIIGRIAQHISGLPGTIMKRVVLSPRDLEDSNINLVNGDPYSGACSLDQFMAWRPISAAPGHKTPIDGLYHIGASTHPGPGLAGTSGYIVSGYFK